jgi:hypothetical protein
MKSAMKVVGSIVLGFGGLSSTAAAENICVDLKAAVTYVDDRESVLQGRVGIGDSVSAQYIYDTSVVDNNSLAAVADYWHYASPNGVTLNVGGLTFRTNPNYVNFLIEILDNHTGLDAYLFRSYNNEVTGITLPPADDESLHISWQLVDGGQTAVTSVELPTTPPDISKFGSYGLSVDYDAYGDHFSRFRIRSEVTSAELCVTDEDGDGVEDDVDACPVSETSAGVIVGGIDTGVANAQTGDGCTVADLLKAAGTGRHFASEVARITNGLVSRGILTGKDKGKLQSAAAKSR